MFGLLLTLAAAAAHPSAPSPYFLDNSTVVFVECQDQSGTAVYIGNGRFLTARHVVLNGDKEHSPNDHCTVGGKKVRIIEIGKGKSDYALVSAAFYPSHRAIVSCEPFKEGEEYFASGYADGNHWVVTQRLIGTAAHVTRRSDLDYGTAFLRGATTEGQSGGPVSDRDGLVHGIVSGGPDSGATEADTVALADTPYCKEHAQ